MLYRLQHLQASNILDVCTNAGHLAHTGNSNWKCLNTTPKAHLSAHVVGKGAYSSSPLTTSTETGRNTAAHCFQMAQSHATLGQSTSGCAIPDSLMDSKYCALTAISVENATAVNVRIMDTLTICLLWKTSADLSMTSLHRYQWQVELKNNYGINGMGYARRAGKHLVRVSSCVNGAQTEMDDIKLRIAPSTHALNFAARAESTLGITENPSDTPANHGNVSLYVKTSRTLREIWSIV